MENVNFDRSCQNRAFRYLKYSQCLLNTEFWKWGILEYCRNGRGWHSLSISEALLIAGLGVLIRFEKGQSHWFYSMKYWRNWWHVNTPKPSLQLLSFSLKVFEFEPAIWNQIHFPKNWRHNKSRITPIKTSFRVDHLL